MNREEEKYNNTKARYIATMIVRHRYNKNMGMSYSQGVAQNKGIKASIDYWLELMDRQNDKEEKCRRN